ncbi:MAG: UDP-3-O-(3-hydroxymyristoyl)glucosamine N-acyltransferase [Rickettsiales bacterium]|nr:UDP-3-O-(3-hydroxymyristoyl)glucosamine N-acyltransferase [Pseudomonadota bacterium]MDA0966503.1 UDP-3-O-(3-hydroxymyristoyl)glucosamine N-acyltransferase [Pseudomonadota bacterium]MDG4543365.1 UDP-3-O-(3-hydroxymyristoyl)glucosamine N-acyltransferase [Rickettsiales bacterium]MDG4545631.1 UDP-3-O-(3-hydroxymyristoyl)glucosamine N-acyltransferase [Rickettsiales bacterium]MDG4548080.1 UDP-3-O-(3-hydroxymyristoyl)glucosamine N-acyltransferase [Rickettsiales bacterium]
MPDLEFFDSIESLSLEEIAKIAGAKIYRSEDSKKKFAGVAPIDAAKSDEVTFLSNKKYGNDLMSSKAGACIMSAETIEKAPKEMDILVSDNPYAAYAKVATKFYPINNNNNNDISENAYISESAKVGQKCRIEAGAYVGNNVTIGSGCYIASGAYIGDSVKIGNDCIIRHGVTVSHTIIGNNVILHPGVKVGQDGFGFATDKGVHIKVPQLGRVIIEDDVEIGANSCVDRGAGPDTVIGRNTKIDNLVQIGHNVKIGKGCIIVSHVGISGSTKIGDYTVIGGQVGVAGHLKIGSMVTIAAQSGVMHNIEDGMKIGGSPAINIKDYHRQTIAIKKLLNKKG